MSIHVCVRERERGGEEIVAAFAEKAPRVGERVVYYTSKRQTITELFYGCGNPLRWIDVTRAKAIVDRSIDRGQMESSFGRPAVAGPEKASSLFRDRVREARFGTDPHTSWPTYDQLRGNIVANVADR